MGHGPSSQNVFVFWQIHGQSSSYALPFFDGYFGRGKVLLSNPDEPHLSVALAPYPLALHPVRHDLLNLRRTLFEPAMNFTMMPRK